MSAFALVTLRRLLRPWFVTAALVLGFLAARGTSAAGDELARAARALARGQAWSLLALLALVLVPAAAALGRPAERRAWLAGGSARGALALGTTLGVTASAVLLCLALALASEAALGGSAPGVRLRARPPTPAHVLHDDDAALRWSVARPSGTTRARLTLGLARGSGTSVELRWSVRDGSQSRSTDARLATRGALELELPPASGGPLELELTRLGSGVLVVLSDDALELLAPAGSERRAGPFFALHAALALTAVLASALVLARFLPAGLASLLALAGFGLLASRALGPTGEWLAAWHELGLGRVPSAPSGPALAWTLLGLLGATLALALDSERAARAP